MSMRVFDLAIPGVTIGYGARRQLPELAAAYGRRVGVVTDPGMAAQPSFDECVQLLRDGGMDVTTFTDVVADPPIVLEIQRSTPQPVTRPGAERVDDYTQRWTGDDFRQIVQIQRQS